MNMKRLLTLVAFFATLQASAQQINPVPDYVFRNQMSVGRNAVTDTAAYFSIGPRYGATKGFMPPIVGDTATFSSGKRNGLLIFSVQKNKFLYWDSVRVQWSDMAGGSGSYILAGDTSAMLAPYLRKADTTAMLTNYVRHAGYGLTKSGQSFLVDTLNIATRAWRQKGLDSLAALEVSGSGTTNYVPKFTAGSTIGNSQIFDNGSTIGIGSTAGTYYVEAKRNGTADIVANSSADNNSAVLSVFNSGGASGNFAQLRAYGNTTASTLFGSSTNKMISLFSNGDALMTLGTISATPLVFGTTNTERLRITSGGDVGIGQPSLLWTATNRRLLELNGTSQSLIGLNVNSLKAGYIWQNGNDMTIATENAGYIQFGTNGSSDRMRIFSNGRIGINTTTDAGYQLDINGTLRSVNGANFATSSGNVGIGTASPAVLTHISSGYIAPTGGFDANVRLAITNSGSNDRFAGVSINSGSIGGSFINFGDTDDENVGQLAYFHSDNHMRFTVNASERGRINSAGEWIIDASGTDAGDYKLQVSGNIYNTGSAVLAATSGNVGIGTASPTNAKLVVEGSSAGTVGAIMSTDVAGTTSFVRVVGDVGSQNLLNWQTGTALRFATSTQTYGTFAEHARINSAGELLINTTSDAGDYKLQVSGNIYNTGSAVLAATSGNVGIGATTINAKLHVLSATGTAQSLGDWANNIAIIQGASRTGTTAVGGSFATTLSLQSNDDVITAGSGASVGFSAKWNSALYGSAAQFASIFGGKENGSDASLAGYLSFATRPAGGNPTERGRINSAGEWIIDASGTDAGDYKLQVVGNARIGTGKLDIASNTTFGLGVARSGTSEVAGQIYNSNGILYLGAESSAGGQIFSGSSAYAAVIGSGANYPLQFATNNITRATMTTSGNLLLGFTTDSYFLKLQVNGSIFSNNQVLAQGVNAQIAADSSANISPLYISNQSLTGSSAQGLFYGSTTWNTTGNPSLIDLNITNTASGATSNYIKISDGSNIFRVTKAAEVVTAAPTGGSIRRWKLGEAATVSPTSPNRTIRVEIDGTVYYLHAKTTND